MAGRVDIRGLAPLSHVTKRKRLIPYKVRAYHDDCGGELVATEHGNTVGGPTPWMHRCRKCGAIGIIVGANYPAIVYDEVK